MKITVLIPVALLAASLAGPIVRGQDNGAATTQPAPITVNGVVHVQTLPTPPSLMKDAEAEGLTILRMEQSPDRIIVVYQYPSGATRAFAYTTRVETTVAPVASAVTSAMPLSTATYSVVSQAAPTTVVYTQPSTVYYTPNYVRYYDPYYYPWAPLALGVGIGMTWNYGYYGHGGHVGHVGYGGHPRH